MSKTNHVVRAKNEVVGSNYIYFMDECNHHGDYDVMYRWATHYNDAGLFDMKKAKEIAGEYTHAEAEVVSLMNARAGHKGRHDTGEFSPFRTRHLHTDEEHEEMERMEAEWEAEQETNRLRAEALKPLPQTQLDL